MIKKKAGRIHFIAIGGATMHNLALALQQKGYDVSGSDDEIMEPSFSRLKAAGILPGSFGWDTSRITDDLEAVILGMHARTDNPELLKAQQMGIKIYSYPEYIYEQSKDKTRVVIGGSHGKTTITSMVLFVLKQCQIDFDYMAGAKIEGFDTMVKLSDAPILIVEGDEYLSSPIDRRPKFHLYKADIGLISGIAWDHINVFPTYESYVEQFKIFAEGIPEKGSMIYCDEDPGVRNLIKESVIKGNKISYGIPKHEIRNGVTYLEVKGDKTIALQIFGSHNLMNLEGARKICLLLGLDDDQFYKSISGFKGAARRLELLAKNDHVTVYKDFAHSPSKVQATVDAVKLQFPERKIIACLELHTFSSLNDDFLDQYAGTMDKADLPIVYFNPRTIEHKKLAPIKTERIHSAFLNNKIKVYTDSEKFKTELLEINPNEKVFLLMSSGNFDGLSLEEIASKLVNRNLVNS